MAGRVQPFWSSRREQQGEVSSVVEVWQLLAGPWGHWSWYAGLLWERRLKEKPARAQGLLVVWTYSDLAGGLTWAGRGLDVCGAWDAVLSCGCGGGRLQICVEKRRHNSCFVLPWHEGMSCMAGLPLSLKHPLFLHTQREMTAISA